MGNSNTIVVMMVIYAICHSTALSAFSTHTHSPYREALKTLSGFQSKGLNTQDTQWVCVGDKENDQTDVLSVYLSVKVQEILTQGLLTGFFWSILQLSTAELSKLHSLMKDPETQLVILSNHIRIGVRI